MHPESIVFAFPFDDERREEKSVKGIVAYRTRDLKRCWNEKTAGREERDTVGLVCVEFCNGQGSLWPKRRVEKRKRLHN